MALQLEAVKAGREEAAAEAAAALLRLRDDLSLQLEAAKASKEAAVAEAEALRLQLCDALAAGTTQVCSHSLFSVPTRS